jgi:hypothetical protein
MSAVCGHADTHQFRRASHYAERARRRDDGDLRTDRTGDVANVTVEAGGSARNIIGRYANRSLARDSFDRLYRILHDELNLWSA